MYRFGVCGEQKILLQCNALKIIIIHYNILCKIVLTKHIVVPENLQPEVFLLYNQKGHCSSPLYSTRETERSTQTEQVIACIV